MDNSAETGDRGQSSETIFDEAQYTEVIGAISTLKDRWKEADGEETQGLWQKISTGKNVLQASLKQEPHTNTTLQALLDLRIADPKDFSHPIPDTKKGLVKDALDLSESLTDIPTIEEALEKTADPDRLQLAIQVVQASSRTDTDAIHEQKDFLLRHFEEGLRGEQREKNKDTHYAEAAQKIVYAVRGETIDPQQRQEALAMFRRLISDEQTREIGAYLLNHVYQNVHSMRGSIDAQELKQLINDEVITQVVGDLPIDRSLYGFYFSSNNEIRKLIRLKKIKPLMESYGLDLYDLMDAWGQDGGLVRGNPQKPETVVIDIEQNVEAIRKLEAQRKGICKKLGEEFRIKNFSRFPSEVLIHMYDNIGNKNMKFGVMQYARYDNPFSEHAGAFRNPHMIQQLFDQLQDTDKLGEAYGIRIYEFDGNDELAENMEHAKQHYGTTDAGEENKLAFVYVEAHGSADGLVSGVTRKAQYKRLTKRHFQYRAVKNVGDNFTDDATIILASCSTGAEDGLASAIHDAYGRKVIAPTEEAALRWVTVTRSASGGLDIDAEYNTPHVKRVYEKAA